MLMFGVASRSHNSGTSLLHEDEINLARDRPGTAYIAKSVPLSESRMSTTIVPWLSGYRLEMVRSR